MAKAKRKVAVNPVVAAASALASNGPRFYGSLGGPNFGITVGNPNAEPGTGVEIKGTPGAWSGSWSMPLPIPQVGPLAPTLQPDAKAPDPSPATSIPNAPISMDPANAQPGQNAPAGTTYTAYNPRTYLG